jgi:hypothetical protein
MLLFSTCITSEKPVKYNIAKEGNSNTRKLPVVMLTGLKSDKTFD